MPIVRVTVHLLFSGTSRMESTRGESIAGTGAPEPPAAGARRGRALRERLEQLVEICQGLAKTGFLNCPNMEIKYLPQLSPKEGSPEFDFFVNCEVLQRVPSSVRQDYWQNWLRTAKAGVVFAPNAENLAHATHSKLKTVSLDELIEQAQAAGGEIIASGYLDLPPFPPGIKRSDEQREAAKEGAHRLAFKLIEQWAGMESLIPLSLRRKSAHIVFVAVKRKSE